MTRADHLSPSPVSDWLERFFASYYAHRPVNATFIGVHGHDHQLPDFSDSGAGDTLADMQHLLRESLQLAEEPRSIYERLDLRLAQGFLRTQIWECQSAHFHHGNPSTYIGEAVFGAMSLFLTRFAPLSECVEAAAARMEGVSALLAQAQRNVRRSPLPWTERAVRECVGALAFFTEGVDLLIAADPKVVSRLKPAAERAAVAVAAFRQYLETDLRRATASTYASGEQALVLYFREGHCLNTGAESIAEYAEGELGAASRYLHEHVADFGATDVSGVLARSSAIHPSAGRYYGRYQEVWEEVRETAVANDLLTWPDAPIRYAPRPRWARKAAPHLYFLFYRSPAAFNRPAVHDYFVTPIDSDLPPEEQNRLLALNNDSVIKLNHVIHHGSIGHHVQNWHAFRSRSRIGQIAAVDCASRIAMSCGGTMAEGWACYATDLMNEVGALTPLEQYEEYQARRRMCARAVVDVRLHSGRYTLEQAADYYEQRVGMDHAAAESEAVKNSMFPGAAVIYLSGRDGIQRLRKELSATLGPRWSLRAFHDEFLSYGSIPVALISDEMKRRADGSQ